MTDLVLESVLTCPHCGFAARETGTDGYPRSTVLALLVYEADKDRRRRDDRYRGEADGPRR